MLVIDGRYRSPYLASLDGVQERGATLSSRVASIADINFESRVPAVADLECSINRSTNAGGHP
jgi:hypothetical protein